MIPDTVLEKIRVDEVEPSAWLAAWAEKLLGFKDEPGYWHHMCRDYFDRCCQVVGLDEQAPVEVDQKDTILPSGKAISSLGAAQCTWQGSRTAKFIQGIHKAIVDLRKRFPKEKLRILYAGTGPLAPLALPLLAYMGCEKLDFVCLDIHETSLKRAQKLAKHFGVEEGISEWVCGDAATFSPPDGHSGYHMIISEVMQQALQNEPQVAVTINLSQFLVEGGSFIPERVLLSLQHYDIGSRMNATLNGGGDIALFTQHIADVFELTADTALTWKTFQKRIPAAKVQMSPSTMPKSEPYIFTDIQVYGSIWLKAYECSLNLPVRLNDINFDDSEIEFYYEMGQIPNLKLLKS